LITGVVSMGIIFVFSYMYAQFFASYSLFSDFIEEKREKVKQKTWHFSLFEIKVVTQGVSL
jgi:hypothetical protein